MKTLKTLQAEGIIMQNAIAVIWRDLSNEQPGYFRAFWSNSPSGSTGCPVIGYCSPGGSHRTINAVALEFRRLYKNEPIYRNGHDVRISR